ncbi:hypothetical protein SAMN05428969_0017 [Devosia sp. YR412]|uniref:hypothetical protein n=1 Tax=Devosia sp. YR412 TaxID=1881030 RepID=UPI0008B517E2|nr:hypothetical protein [Devosia sp. YR412]SEP59140.1 hypothetical protein SAMN05428969_0017 [Devosia sp. YR412]
MLNAEIPVYVQLVSGTVLGIALGNLLSGAAKFIQQPHDYKINWLHGLWIAFILGTIMMFWWEEAMTFSTVQWNFWLYMFQIVYCATFLFTSAVLLPENVREFDTHYNYLIARRYWFYGALIVSYLLGIGNSFVKEGWDEIFVDPTYIILNLIVVGLLAVTMVLNRPRLHLATAIIFVLLMFATMFLE